MSIGLRIMLIALSVISLFYIIRKIRYSKMQIEYALFWIVLSLVMIVMAIVPEVMYVITRAVGVMSTANLVFLLIIGILLVKVFMITIELSNLESKVKDLVQRIGIDEKVHREEYERILSERFAQENIEGTKEKQT